MGETAHTHHFISELHPCHTDRNELKAPKGPREKVPWCLNQSRALLSPVPGVAMSEWLIEGRARKRFNWAPPGRFRGPCHGWVSVFCKKVKFQGIHPGQRQAVGVGWKDMHLSFSELWNAFIHVKCTSRLKMKASSLFNMGRNCPLQKDPEEECP